MNGSKEPVLEADLCTTSAAHFWMGSSTDAPQVTAQSCIRGSRFIGMAVLSLLLKEVVLARRCSSGSAKRKIGNSRSSDILLSWEKRQDHLREQEEATSTDAFYLCHSRESFHLLQLLEK